MNLRVKNTDISTEFKHMHLWDKRCNKSISRISKKIYQNQGQSFSSSCGKCLRQNGSRILSDKRVTIDKMQEGHLKQTLKRSSSEKILLVAVDTTHINYSGHNAMIGLGNNSTDKNSLGLLCHNAYLLEESGLPLGILDQKIWTRPKDSYGKKHKWHSLPIEEKESMKWLESLQKCEKKLPVNKHEIWFVSDRESDIFEYLTLSRHKNCHILVRACRPRQLEFESSESTETLFNHLKTLPALGTKTVEISRQHRSELIELNICYDNVRILSPSKDSKNRRSVQMGVVYAYEKTESKENIEWILLVDRPINEISDALKYLGYYAHRWNVERFHYVLKDGLKIENLQFDDVETMKNAIALYSVVAWFTHWITYLGRKKPDTPANEILDETSIEILEVCTKKKVSTAFEILFALGFLGGFLGGSKRYPYPGMKSVWGGIQKLEAMKQGWLLAKSQFLDFYAT
jgi:hypothetical protein